MFLPISCRLSAAGIRFLGYPVPAEDFNLPCGQPTGHDLAPDLNGVAMFHTSEIRPGRVPPIPRDWRCSLTGVGSTGQRLPHFSGQS
jgi:hypothetical protein